MNFNWKMGEAPVRAVGPTISINISKTFGFHLERETTYATINVMNTQPPKPVHVSYLKHRRDLAWKIIFPVVLSAVLCLALVVIINLATFRDSGDVARWAAISTMWIAIPTMVGMLVVLALVAGIVYLLARLLNIAPRYTVIAQDFFYKVKSYAKRIADAIAKPVITIDSIGAGISRIFGKR